MLIATVLFSCSKKSSVTPTTQTTTYSVVFQFNANGNTFATSLTDEQTGIVQTNGFLQSTLSIPATVKVGDKFLVEMRGNADGADTRYNVSVLYNSKQIAIGHGNGIAGVAQQDIKFEMVFTAANFQ